MRAAHPAFVSVVAELEQNLEDLHPAYEECLHRAGNMLRLLDGRPYVGNFLHQPNSGSTDRFAEFGIVPSEHIVTEATRPCPRYGSHR